MNASQYIPRRPGRFLFCITWLLCFFTARSALAEAGAGGPIVPRNSGSFVDPETPAGVQPDSGQRGWVLVFSDEFNGTTLDTSKWHIDVSSRSRAARWDRGIHDWWWVEENVWLDGEGNLVLDVSKYDSNTMHCGSISSDGIFEPLYGYMEARIQVADTTKDTHTAFWLQGPNMRNSDPADGTAHDGAEVDIFESAWFGDYTKSVVHIDGYDAEHRANTQQYDTPGLHSGYHTFGMEWTAEYLKIYYNGEHKVTYTGIWVPRVAEWLWLSVGASFGDIGTFTSEPVGWLTSAKVDYVRYWQNDGNRPPYFTSDPVVKAPAFYGQAYSATLAGDVINGDGGDIIGYAKTSGPDWLTVAADGSLSGTPTRADAGTNRWTVTVTDQAGGSSSTTLEIVVNPLAGHTLLVGGTLRNGDFNANPGTAVFFSETDHWYNTKGAQNQVATRSDFNYDGSQNGTLTSGRGFGIDTGHTLAEGDEFSFSYVWQDDWNWIDGSHQVNVALFVTDDDTITGTRTNLLVDASGLRQTDGAYEAVSRESAYIAEATHAGKTLFAAIETSATGFARIDNFVLSVNPQFDFAAWADSYDLAPEFQALADDPEGDDLANGIEAWLGTHPGEFSTAMTEFTVTGPVFSFQHPMNDEPPTDINGHYEWSPNLRDWYAGDGLDGPSGGPTVLFEVTVVGQTAYVTATASSEMDRIFARIVVSTE